MPHSPFNRIGQGLTEDREQLIVEEVACERCWHVWPAMQPLGSDYRRLRCPFCGSRNSELAEETLNQVVRVH